MAANMTPQDSVAGSTAVRSRVGAREHASPTGGTLSRVRREMRTWRYSAGESVQGASTWMRETITPGGWLLLGVTVLGFVVGLPLGWVELVSAALVCLTLVLLALLFLIGRTTYAADLHVTRDRVVVGEGIEGKVTVRYTGRGIRFPSQVEIPVGAELVEIAVPFLRSGGEFTQMLSVPTSKRGVVTVGPVQATQSSPLGIFASDTRWGVPHDVYVYPRTTALPSTEIGLMRDLEGMSSPRIVSDDLSFHAIREYFPGDIRRHIHWKSTAKTGHLMVRQYDQTVRSEMMVVLDNNRDGYADEEEFEVAVSAAASLGIRGLLDGRHLAVVTGPQDERSVGRSGHETTVLAAKNRRLLLDELTTVKSVDESESLRTVTEHAAQKAEEVSIVVLICGSQLKLEDIQSAALRLPPEVGVMVVRCDVEGEPRLRIIGATTVISIAILEDLRHILVGRRQK